MASRIVHCSTALMEACWIVAVLLIPLFFNPFSQSIFEPDKVSLLRSLAILSLAAWGWWWFLERRGAAEKLPWRIDFPGKGAAGQCWRVLILFASIGLLFLAEVIATCLSISPRISLWGVHPRMQGLFTTASYLILYLSLSLGLREKVQLERLIRIVILTSFPISLYGIVQHYHLDPLLFPETIIDRCASTLGNPIFLGGYLVMIVPLTLQALLRSGRKMTKGLQSKDWAWGGCLALLTGATLVIAVVLLATDISSPGSWTVIAVLAVIQVLLYVRVPEGSMVNLLLIAMPLVYGMFFISLNFLDLVFALQGSWYFGAVAGVTCLFALGALLLSQYARTQGGNVLSTSVLTVVLVVQVSCLLFTQSRGPLLALALGGLFFLVFWGAGTGKRRAAWVALSVVLLGMAGYLAFMALDNPVRKFIQSSPGLGRLVDLQHMPSVRARAILWEGCGVLLERKAPLVYYTANGTSVTDPWSGIRSLTGYGPETFPYVYAQVHPPELMRMEPFGRPDRAHNAVLNARITKGWLGTGGLLLVLTAFLGSGLRMILDGMFRVRLFALFWLTGVAGGLIISFAGGHSALMALGIAGGMLTGMGLLGGWHLLWDRRTRTLEAGNTPKPFPLCALALTTGVLVHFIEIQFSFPVAATGMLFWVFGGVLTAMTLRPRLLEVGAEPAEDQKDGKTSEKYADRHCPGPFPNSVLYAVVLAMILVVILFELLPIPGYALHKAASPLLGVGLSGSWTGPLSLILGVGLIFAMLFVSMSKDQDRDDRPSRSEGPSFFRPALFFAACLTAVVFAMAHSRVLQIMANRPGLWPHVFTWFSVLVLAMLMFLGSAVRPRPSEVSCLWPGAPAGALLLAAVFGAYHFACHDVRAEISYRNALSLSSRQQFLQSVEYLEQALDSAPEASRYHTAMGHAYARTAQRQPPKDARPWLAKAERRLVSALDLEPFDSMHHANLARLYQAWSLVSDHRKKELLERSGRFYRQALQLAPNDYRLRLEWAENLLGVGSEEPAREQLIEVISLMPDLPAPHLLLGEMSLNKREWEQAAREYRKALAHDADSLEALSGLGQALAMSGRLEEAAAAYSRAVELAPGNYSDLKNLALVYEQMGKRSEAIHALEQALLQAPVRIRPQLEQALEAMKEKAAPEGRP